MSSHKHAQKAIRPRFPFLIREVVQRPFLAKCSGADSSSPTDGFNEILKAGCLLECFGKGYARRQNRCRATINTLRDDVLLEIFDFYRADFMNYVGPTCTWHRLAHVCRRWRHIVFTSQSRLDLRIACTESTPVRKLLDVWPPLPIIIRLGLYSTTTSKHTISNAITALERRNRVCQIQLSHMTQFLLDMLDTAMQEPYPVLTGLELSSDEEMAPVLPDNFLGGSAPSLQSVWLEGIALPSLPKLLLSAVGLVSLLLDKIPQNTGNISPEVMATCLSTLMRLKFLRLDFRPPVLLLNIRRHSRPSTRAILPCLSWLEFRGVREYVEDLMARIEAPLLEHVNVKLFNRLVFDVPQILQFISHSEKLNSPHHATVTFQSDFGQITLSPPRGIAGSLTIQVLCTASHQQVSAIVQICNQALSLLSSVKRLKVCGGEFSHSIQEWQHGIEGNQLLELFEPFTGVEDLHVTEYLGSLAASALREACSRGRAAEVFPVLQSLFLDEHEPSEHVQGVIRRFITARGCSSGSVTVCRRKSEWASDLGWEKYSETGDYWYAPSVVDFDF